jgi:hypothetical protein
MGKPQRAPDRVDWFAGVVRDYDERARPLPSKRKSLVKMSRCSRVQGEAW